MDTIQFNKNGKSVTLKAKGNQLTAVASSGFGSGGGVTSLGTTSSRENVTRASNSVASTLNVSATGTLPGGATGSGALEEVIVTAGKRVRDRLVATPLGAVIAGIFLPTQMAGPESTETNSMPNMRGAEGGMVSSGSPGGFDPDDPNNKTPVTSRIKENPRLVKEAQVTGRSHQASIDKLTAQLQRGNTNPGIGSKPIGRGLSEARARDGARVYFRETRQGIEILGKSHKANQQVVIREVLKTFGN